MATIIVPLIDTFDDVIASDSFLATDTPHNSPVWDFNRPDVHPDNTCPGGRCRGERRDLRRAGSDAVCMSL